MTSYKTLTSSTLICGNQFRRQANYVYDEIRHPIEAMEFIHSATHVGAKQFCNFNCSDKTNIIFCSTDRISNIINDDRILPDKINDAVPILITHHSDININQNKNVLKILERLEEINGIWLAQNCLIQHPRIIPIPIGVEDIRLMNDRILLTEMYNSQLPSIYMQYNTKYTQSIYANFRIHADRATCQQALDRLEIKNSYDANKPIQQYYREITNYDFIISPEGAGIDCHRHWEALYLKTVPIVLRTCMTEYFSHFYPMVLVEHWDMLDEVVDQIYNGKITKTKIERNLIKMDSDTPYWNLNFNLLWSYLINIEIPSRIKQ